jgi:hypothetical protein
MIISGFGLLLHFFQPKKLDIKSDPLSPGLLLMIILFPYLFSYIRGDAPFPRTFLISLPVFLLLVTDGLQIVVNKLKNKQGADAWIEPAFWIFIFISCNTIFLNSYFNNRAYVYANLEADRRENIENVDQRIWASHFLEHYHLMPMIEAIQATDSDMPVMIDKENTVYEWVVRVYLDTFGIQGTNFTKPSEIPPENDFILISSFFSDSYLMLQGTYPDIQCSSLLEEVSIYRGFRCGFGQNK